MRLKKGGYHFLVFSLLGVAFSMEKSPLKEVDKGFKCVAIFELPSNVFNDVSFDVDLVNPLFERDPSVHDIRQAGSYGNCYFMSAMHSVLYQPWGPATIRSLFQDGGEQYPGKVLMKANGLGVDVCVLIPRGALKVTKSSFFGLRKTKAFLGGASSNGIWASILESAWGLYRRSKSCLDKLQAKTKGKFHDNDVATADLKINTFNYKHKVEVMPGYNTMNYLCMGFSPEEILAKLTETWSSLDDPDESEITNIETVARNILLKSKVVQERYKLATDHFAEASSTLLGSITGGFTSEVFTFLFGERLALQKTFTNQICGGSLSQESLNAQKKMYYSASHNYNVCESAVFTFVEKALEAGHPITGSVLYCGDKSREARVDRMCADEGKLKKREKKLQKEIEKKAKKEKKSKSDSDTEEEKKKDVYEDESELNGLFYPHAYAISAVHTKADGTKWIQMTNPWLESGRGYCIVGSTDTDTDSQRFLRLPIPSGVFWLELRDFVSDVHLLETIAPPARQIVKLPRNSILKRSSSSSLSSSGSKKKVGKQEKAFDVIQSDIPLCEIKSLPKTVKKLLKKDGVVVGKK